VKWLYPKASETRSKSSCFEEFSLFEKFSSLYYDYDIRQDPFYSSLTDPMKRQKVLLKRKTYCYDQLKSLHTNAEKMRQELGVSAAKWFPTVCLNRFLVIVDNQTALVGNIDEKAHLGKLLSQLSPYLKETESFNNVAETVRSYSAKVEQLVQTLKAEWSSSFTGIIFAEQRAFVQALVQILSTHPSTADKFRVEGFVGMSTYVSKKKQISELADP
jgi:hypothetical protein